MRSGACMCWGKMMRERHGTRKGAKARATYLQGEKESPIFAGEGYRPWSTTVGAKVKGRFAPVPRLFSVADFGGWETVNSTFFGDDGLWDQLFRKRRG